MVGRFSRLNLGQRGSLGVLGLPVRAKLAKESLISAAISGAPGRSLVRQFPTGSFAMSHLSIAWPA